MSMDHPLCPEDPYALHNWLRIQPMYPEYMHRRYEILPPEEAATYLPDAHPTADLQGYVLELIWRRSRRETIGPRRIQLELPYESDEDEEGGGRAPSLLRLFPTCTPYDSQEYHPGGSIHITFLLWKEFERHSFLLTTPHHHSLTPLSFITTSTISPFPTSRYNLLESSAIKAATRPDWRSKADYVCRTMRYKNSTTETRCCRLWDRDVWIDPREAVEEVAPMTLGGVNARVTELTAVQEQDTQDIYAVIEDTQDRQTQIYQSVETLFDDSQYHYETARLLDQEALVSREAWGRSIEVSYMTRSKILALRSVVIGQQAVISQLQAADRKSQVVTLEMLQADYQRQVQLAEALKLLKGLQTQMVEFQRQHGPAKGPAQPDAPGEAGSSS
ncbi:hypothetical protein Tco_0894951 [Tanacetum coccineum]|uniref:Uncharacterized protein n=1 Tax=Tanacetum coccineum TaxID=301880 RepID=A0ABQ5CJG0_9ASTR